jgi:hypothetical protein
MIKFSLRKDGRFGDQRDRRHSGFVDRGETRSVIASGGEHHDLLVWGGKSTPVDWHEASVSFHEMATRPN